MNNFTKQTFNLSFELPNHISDSDSRHRNFIISHSTQRALMNANPGLRVDLSMFLRDLDLIGDSLVIALRIDNKGQKSIDVSEKSLRVEFIDSFDDEKLQRAILATLCGVISDSQNFGVEVGPLDVEKIVHNTRTFNRDNLGYSKQILTAQQEMAQEWYPKHFVAPEVANGNQPTSWPASINHLLSKDNGNINVIGETIIILKLPEFLAKVEEYYSILTEGQKLFSSDYYTKLENEPLIQARDSTFNAYLSGLSKSHYDFSTEPYIITREPAPLPWARIKRAFLSANGCDTLTNFFQPSSTQEMLDEVANAKLSLDKYIAWD